MPAKIIDGKIISKEIRSELAEKIKILKKQNVVPGLATILVGSNPASKLYVGMKQKACAEIGLYSNQYMPQQSVNRETVHCKQVIECVFNEIAYFKKTTDTVPVNVPKTG